MLDGRTLTEAIQGRRNKPARATEQANNGQRPEQLSKARRVQSRKVAAFKVPCKVAPNVEDTEAGQQAASKQAPPPFVDRTAGTPPMESAGAQESNSSMRPLLQKSHAVSSPVNDKGISSMAAVELTARDTSLRQPVADLSSGAEGKSGKVSPAIQPGVKIRQMQVGRRRRMAQLPRKSTRFAAMAAGIEALPLQGNTAPPHKSSARDRSANTTGSGSIDLPAAEDNVAEAAEITGKPDQTGEEGTLVVAAADGSDGKRRRVEILVGCDPLKVGRADQAAAGKATSLAHDPTGENQNTPPAEQAVPVSGESGEGHKEAAANRRAAHSISDAVGTDAVLDGKKQRRGWAQGFTAEVARAAQPTQLHPLQLQVSSCLIKVI